MAEATVQVWRQQVGDRLHEVEGTGSFRHEVVWRVDGEEVARKKDLEDTLRLSAEDHGRLVVRWSALGAPQRATLHGPDGDPTGLTDGTDLEPEPGSPAAAYEEKVLAHPQRYAAIQTGAAIVKVGLPILIAALGIRFVVKLPWPDWDLPRWDLPDLPSIPWPDLPSIPWPDWSLPDWSLPGWVGEVLDVAKLVVPVLIAFALARGEITRRRRHAEERAAARRAGEATDDGSQEAEEDPTDRG